jgi:hypothetical protein
MQNKMIGLSYFLLFEDIKQPAKGVPLAEKKSLCYGRACFCALDFHKSLSC